jgi:phosphatidate cytidylyltransferase
MKKRILFGSIMIVVICGVLLLDWWMQTRATAEIVASASQPAATSAPAAMQPPQRFAVGLPVAVLVLVLTMFAFVEYTRMSVALGVLILPTAGLVGSAFLATLPFWWQLASPDRPTGTQVMLLAAFVVMAAFFEQMIRSRTEDALRRLASTLFCVLYLGLGGALMLSVRVDFGVPALVLFLAAVKFTDIGAYFTGSAVGRHKLIPWLSPGKSWEGLVGGVVVGAGMSVLAAWGLRVGLSPGTAATFGAVVGVVGQFGDLCESLLKRSARVKDSGAVVPEFGGVLDIVDSPLLAAPAAYVFLALAM